MQLGGRHRALREGLKDLAQEAVSVEQHLIAEEHIVDANNTRFVQFRVVELEAATMQGEVERVVDVVVEVGACADHEVDRATLHQREDRATDARRSHRSGDRQADRHVLLRVEHAARVQVSSLAQTPRVVGLKAGVYQVGGADSWLDAVRVDELAAKEVFGAGRMIWLVVDMLWPLGAFMWAVWQR